MSIKYEPASVPQHISVTSLNLPRRAVGKIGLSIVEEERHGPSGAKTERGACTCDPCAFLLDIMLRRMRRGD